MLNRFSSCREESSRHKESTSTIDNIDSVTDGLQTKVVIDHGEKHSAESVPAEKPAIEQKPAERQQAVAERHSAVESNHEPSSGGSWAKIAARPVDTAAKPAVET